MDQWWQVGARRRGQGGGRYLCARHAIQYKLDQSQAWHQFWIVERFGERVQGVVTQSFIERQVEGRGIGARR